MQIGPFTIPLLLIRALAALGAGYVLQRLVLGRYKSAGRLFWDILFDMILAGFLLWKIAPLFFRLKTIHVELPPLRRITEDIEILCCHYITKFCQQWAMSKKGYSAEFLEGLLQYEWPGNVRELVNCIAHALSCAGQEPTLFFRHLPTAVRAQLARQAVSRDTAGEEEVAGAPLETDRLEPLAAYRHAHLQRLERHYLQTLMQRYGTDIARACEVAGLSRPRLYALLKRYGIARDGGCRSIGGS